jgi:hypothetical protein
MPVGVESEEQLCSPESFLRSDPIKVALDLGGEFGNANFGDIIFRDEVDVAARVFHDRGDTLAILKDVVAGDNTRGLYFREVQHVCNIKCSNEACRVALSRKGVIVAGLFNVMLEPWWNLRGI